MKILLLTIFITCTVVTVVVGQIELRSTCPPLATVANFNSTAYLGRWYELYRYDNTPATGKALADCVITDLSKSDKNDTLTARYEISVITEADASHNHTKVEKLFTNGTLKLAESDSTTPAGHLLANNGGNTTNYLVLSTDYESYALVWNCENFDGNRSQQSFWVLSRHKNFTAETDQKVKDLLPELHIESRFLRQTEQSERCEIEVKSSASMVSAVFKLLLIFALSVNRI